MSMTAKFASAKQPVMGGADEFGGVGERMEGLSGESSAAGVSRSKTCQERRVWSEEVKDVFSSEMEEGVSVGVVVGNVCRGGTTILGSSSHKGHMDLLSMSVTMCVRAVLADPPPGRELKMSEG